MWAQPQKKGQTKKGGLMKTARGSGRRPGKIQSDSEKLPDLMELIQSASRAGRWEAKIHLAKKVLILHRRQLWVGVEPDRPNLLLIVGPGGHLGKIIGFHLPMKLVTKSGLLALVGDLNDPQFKP